MLLWGSEGAGECFVCLWVVVVVVVFLGGSGGGSSGKENGVFFLPSVFFICFVWLFELCLVAVVFVLRLCLCVFVLGVFLSVLFYLLGVYFGGRGGGLSGLGEGGRLDNSCCFILPNEQAVKPFIRLL